MGAVRESNECLRQDNRNLRDQLHELKMGQRALATAEEVREEMTAQRKCIASLVLPMVYVRRLINLDTWLTVSPALHESFSALYTPMKAYIDAIPEQTSQLSAQKVKTMFLEFRDKAEKEQKRNGPSQQVGDCSLPTHLHSSSMPAASTKAPQALSELLKHLITLLGPIHDIADSLDSIRDLPRALSDVAIFKGVMDGLMTKLHDQPTAPARQHNAGSIENLKQYVGELERNLMDGAYSKVRQEDITGVLDELAIIKQEVKALTLRLDTTVCSPSIFHMSELLGAATAVNQTLVHIKAKVDDLPRPPVTSSVDLSGVERQFVGLNEKIAELKSLLNKDSQREKPAGVMYPFTPVSKRLSLLPDYSVLQSHRQSQQSFPRIRMSPVDSERNHSRVSATQIGQDPVDVFGEKRSIPPAHESQSVEDELSDPYKILERLTETHPFRTEQPSSSTIGSQTMRTASSSSGSRTSSNGQHRVKKIKLNLGQSSVRTRAQWKSVGNTRDHPIGINEETPPNPSVVANVAEPAENQEALTSIGHDSPMRQTQTQTETQTLTTDQSLHSLLRCSSVVYPRRVGTLHGGTARTPSLIGFRKPMTYSSLDKKKNGKKVVDHAILAGGSEGP